MRIMHDAPTSSIISKPGNERLWAMAISNLFPAHVSFANTQTSPIMIAKADFEIKIRVKFMKIRGYLSYISVGISSAKAVTSKKKD